MKKITALLLAMITVLSLSVAMILPTHAGEVTYRDVSPKHWAYDSIAAVTEAGLMHGKGKTAGEYFDKNGSITNFELYTTLYRLAGEVNIEPTFDLYYKDTGKWFDKACQWAVYNGIAFCDYTYGGELGSAIDFFRYKATGWDYYQDVLKKAQSGICSLPDAEPYSRYLNDYNSGKGTIATRTDIVLSLYYYLTCYLKYEPIESADLNVFKDWDDKFLKDNRTLVSVYPFNCGEEKANVKRALEWAVGAGIIKGYPDDTLGLYRSIDNDLLHKYVTRAEYAVILDRFMQYLEEIK